MQSIILLLIYLFSAYASVEHDCYIIKNFATVYTNAGVVYNWNMTSPTWCCEADQFTCVNYNGELRITAIFLEGNYSKKIRGTLYEGVFKGLNYLTSILVDHNNLDGTLEFCKYLCNLTALFLENNHFSGNIDYLFPLKDVLQSVDISGNYITGNLSIFSQFTQLTSLGCQFNYLDGTLEPLQNLTRLTFLEISSNNFYGPISYLSQLTALTCLQVSNNALYGDLSFLSNYTQLIVLFLSGNKLSGTVDSIAGLNSIVELDLSNNHFFGNLSALRNLVRIYNLNIAQNSFEGNLSFLSNLKTLVSIRLCGNYFVGDFSYLSNLINLVIVLASNNHFESTLQSFSTLTNLHYLDVSYNCLYGDLSPLASLVKLYYFSCSKNRLTGSVKVLNHLTLLRNVELYGNQFNSGFIRTSDLPLLVKVNFSSNNFVNDFPVDVTNNNNHSFILDIRNNAFKCPYPNIPTVVEFLYSDCIRPWEEVLIYSFMLLGALVAFYMFWKWLIHNYQQYFTNISWVLFTSKWLWGLLSLVSSYYYLAIILQHLFTRIYPSCNLFNQPSLFLPFMKISDLAEYGWIGGSFDTFLDVQSYNFFVNITADIYTFTQLCETVNGCSYDAFNRFTGDPLVTFNNTHHYFAIMILILVSLKTLLELLKAGAILVSLWYRRVVFDGILTELIGSSMFVFLLLYFVPSSRKLVDYKLSSIDYIRQLFHFIFLDATQSFLLTYYALHVINTDLPAFAIVSLLCSGATFAFTFARLLHHFYITKKESDTITVTVVVSDDEDIDYIAII